MKNNKKFNILVVVQSNFPHDSRVKQEVMKLFDEGHSLTVMALRDKDQKKHESSDNLDIYRVPKFEFFQKYDEDNNKPSYFKKFINTYKQIVGYSIEYFYFTFVSFFFAIYLMVKKHFDVLHIHNPPDTLVFIALVFKLLGKKVVYDHHDLAPDLFLEKFNNRKNLIHKVLSLFEKWSCKVANVVIATNESYKQVECDRCKINKDKIFVVRNGPDLNRIKRLEPVESLVLNNKIKLGYLGEINFQDGVDNIIKILYEIVHKHHFTNIQLVIIGDGDYLPKIKDYTKEFDLQEHVHFTGYLTDSKLLNRYLSSVDIFIDAAPFSFLNDNSTFVKHMEYMIFGKPIVSYNLKENAYSIQNAGIFVNSFNNELMAEEIIKLINDPKKCEELGKNALERVKELTWDRVSVKLIDAYAALAK